MFKRECMGHAFFLIFFSFHVMGTIMAVPSNSLIRSNFCCERVSNLKLVRESEPHCCFSNFQKCDCTSLNMIVVDIFMSLYVN